MMILDNDDRWAAVAAVLGAAALVLTLGGIVRGRGDDAALSLDVRSGAPTLAEQLPAPPRE